MNSGIYANVKKITVSSSFFVNANIRDYINELSEVSNKGGFFNFMISELLII